jgi:hypothetical protein
MMTARPQFDPDSAYVTHPRSGALHYEPLPDETLRQLARLDRLAKTAPDATELEWLQEQAALVMAERADCQRVRHTGQAKRDRNPRHELRYGRRGAGPRNKSGRAKS